MTAFEDTEFVDEVFYGKNIREHSNGRGKESVLWSVLLELCCTQCDQQARWRGRSKEAVTKVAQLAGWMFAGPVVRCPAHSGLSVHQYDSRETHPAIVPRPPIRSLVQRALELTRLEKEQGPKRRRISDPPHCTYRKCSEPVAPKEEWGEGVTHVTRCSKHLAEGRANYQAQKDRRAKLREQALASGNGGYLIDSQLKRLKADTE